MNINFAINTKRKYSNDFYGIFAKSFRLSEYKFFELEVLKYTHDSILFELNMITDICGSHHAGPEISLYVWQIMVRASIYDSRHWDDEKNDWCYE